MDSLKHYNVVIIGAGPAGVGVAVELSKQGVDSIAVIERNGKIGGIPSLYKKKKGGVRTFIRWSRGGLPAFGSDYSIWLEMKLQQTSAEIKLQSHVTCIQPGGKRLTYVSPSEGKVDVTADAIIMACGAREKTISERGWLAGSRPSKVLFTKQLLDLIDDHKILPFKKPTVLGSDILAYAAAAKLENAGASTVTIVDRCNSPKSPFFERLYFRIWSNPVFKGIDSHLLEIIGNKTVSGVKFNNKTIKSDGIVICGELIPNSELALLGGLDVDPLSRIPAITNGCLLSEPGWFVAGNILGGFHGAEWCFYNGVKVGKQVVKYIKNRNGI